MIRLSLLFLYTGGLCLLAFKSWYRALCGLILLMAVIEHPDMPKKLLGIQGLNPWNLGLFCVVLGWALQRRHEGLRWDMPRSTAVAIAAYVAMMFVSTVRLILGPLGDLPIFVPSMAGMVSDYFVNTFKWIVPGLLLYDGCRSRRRFAMAMAAFLGVYFLLAVQVIRWMPLGNLFGGEDLSERSLKILSNEVGYHRVNLSTMLAGASWAILAAATAARGWLGPFLAPLAAGVVLFGQALTGGRAGYVTWMAVGLALSLVRWRRYLLIIPIVAVVVLAALPPVRARLLAGFTPETRDTSTYIEQTDLQDEEAPDAYTITAGRNVIWPYVIDKIEKRPWLGFGRQAMLRTGLARRVWDDTRELFPHPHNAYLEWLLDNGWLGMLCLAPFYAIVLIRGLSLFRDSRSPIFVAAGGACLATVLALMFGAVGSQTFYPREGAVGMWCAMGLMLRVYVERSQALRVARDVAASQPQPPVTFQPWPRRRRKRPDDLDVHLWARAS